MKLEEKYMSICVCSTGFAYSFWGRFLVLPPYLIHRNKHDGQLESDGRIAFSSSSIRTGHSVGFSLFG